ncbi:MAG: lysozyme family protein [Acidimicrobiales bacterium]
MPRRRVTLSLTAPVLAGIVGTAMLIPGGVAPTHAQADLRAGVEAVAPATPVGTLNLRSLPHDERASVGGAMFSEPPPARIRDVLSSALIPTIAVRAYEHAAKMLAKTDPACHLSWADVAGIGRVESDNGLTWGASARVSRNGTLTPPILGPVLDGQNGLPAYPTPDHGRLEGGGRWERAVGPMQFLPSTWFEYSRVSSSGAESPQNFWDAALATGEFLCANGGNLARGRGLDTAILAYNHSQSYLTLVRAWVRFYARAGASQLSAATSKLLPLGISLGRTKRGRSGSPGATADAVLARAVSYTDARHTYELSFEALVGGHRGQVLARGAGAVDLSQRTASMSVAVAGLGTVRLVELATGSGDEGFVALSASVSHRLGEPSGQWLRFSRHLVDALPRPSAAVLLLAGAELLSSVVALDGATRAMTVEGHEVVAGAKTTAYSGPVDLFTASRHQPRAANALGELSRLVGTQRLNMTAWVDHKGFVTEVTIKLPQLSGTASGPVSLSLHLAGFGRRLSIRTPDVVPFPASAVRSSAPMTTTVPTTTTTTTVPPTTSTSTSTSTSTTTTTVPPTTSTSTTTTTTTTALSSGPAAGGQ